jgi:hypothetical protein
MCPVENIIPEPINNHHSKKRQGNTHHSTYTYDSILTVLFSLTAPPQQFKMTMTNCNKNPFDVLHSVTQQTFEKINATDTRTLNRRLKRGVFDMSELSTLSNSILQSILVDLCSEEFKNQFEWVHDYDNLEYFFPLVIAIQALLKELGTMKMTLNDLQADYVKRIERLTTMPLITSSYDYFKKQQVEQPEQVNNNKSFMQGLLSLFTLH